MSGHDYGSAGQGRDFDSAFGFEQIFQIPFLFMSKDTQTELVGDMWPQLWQFESDNFKVTKTNNKTMRAVPDTWHPQMACAFFG